MNRRAAALKNHEPLWCPERLVVLVKVVTDPERAIFRIGQKVMR
jgi:hypothetical protein